MKVRTVTKLFMRIVQYSSRLNRVLLRTVVFFYSFFDKACRLINNSKYSMLAILVEIIFIRSKRSYGITKASKIAMG